MGDTILKIIRDLTLSFGELTVLPRESETKQKQKQTAHKMTKGKIEQDPEPEEEPPGEICLGNENRDPEKGRDEPRDTGETGRTDSLAKAVENEELDEAALARQRGDRLSEDIHLYHYLLVKEIRNVMKDLNETPPRKYSYGEWAWFLRLMGEDENSKKHHRRAHVDPATGEGDKGPHLQSAVCEGGNRPGEEEVKQWSWLGARSPLMGDIGEAEWVLERLSMTLEKQLKGTRDKEKQRGEAGGAQEKAGLPSPGMRGEQQKQSGDEPLAEGSGSRKSTDRTEELERERKKAEEVKDAAKTVDKGRETPAKIQMEK